MPERSQTPGLIARKRKRGPDRLYWSADSLSTKAKGYPARLIPLPADVTEQEIVDLCEVHTARLRASSMTGRSAAYAIASSAIRRAPSMTCSVRRPRPTPTA